MKTIELNFSGSKQFVPPAVSCKEVIVLIIIASLILSFLIDLILILLLLILHIISSRLHFNL